MNKHTLGPWDVEATPSSDLHYIRMIWSATAGEVARVRVGPILEQDEALANARLIAAAPELLAALEYVMEDEPNGVPRASSACRKVVAAAIAKARGEK